ncbi:MAG: hypothetical protein ACO1OX_07740 [Novosphingobium sp.]
MADNKLNLLVRFTGIDKLSGGLRNITAASRISADKVKALRGEVRNMEKDLSRAQKLLASGSMNGGLVFVERELRQAIADTNQEIDRHKRKIEGITSMQGKFRKFGEGAVSAGNAMTVGVTLPLVAFGVTAINASRDAAGAVAQVEASLASMGPVAGRNLGQLQQQAEALMNTSLFDDDEIMRKVTATMLTFGKVSGSSFDRAQQAAVDLSTKLNGDLQGASLQVGKALNDPVKGVTALSRAGIQFTAAQKSMIASMVEAGNVAGAQNVILAELEKQVGGSAAAARKADPGGALAISFGEFQQTVGDKLLPKLTPLVEKATSLLDSFSKLPGPVQNGALAFGAFAVVAGPLVSGVGGLAMAMATLLPMVIANAGASAMLIGVWLPIIAVIGLIAYAVYSNWDTITSTFSSGVEKVKSFFSGLPPWLQSIGAMMMDGLLLAINPMGLAIKLIQMAKNGITAFKNYLGIKSPSRLMMEMGGHVATGLGMGLDKGRGQPVRAMGRMAGAVAGAGAMALAPAAAAPARAAPAQMSKIEIHVHQQPGEDANALAERVARLVEQAQRGKRLRGMGDDF